MATRNVTRQAQALARARERRRALDRARDEHDRQIERATAATLIALEVRAEAARTLDAASRRAGAAIKALLDKDVTVEKAAALLGLETADIRRLTRASAHHSSTTESSDAKEGTRPLAMTDEREESDATRTAG